MASPATLLVKIVADASQASKAFDDTSSSASRWSSGLSKAAGVATVGLAAVGAVMVSGVKAAAEDSAAQAVLATAMKNAAGASDAQVAATEDWISAQTAATGVTDDDLRPALGALVRATGDVGQAQKAAALAMDISAATGKDLTSVSEALAKGYAGNTTSLGRLVPGLDAATLATKDMDAITAALADKVGGSAAAAADTAAGQYKILTAQLAETKEGIGAALLPIVLKLSTALAGLATLASQNTGTLTVLIGVFSALAAVIITVNAVTKALAAAEALLGIATSTTTGLTIAQRVALVATTAAQKAAELASKAWAAAQWLVNAALTANPIGLVVVAIAALVAGLVLAYKQSETFRRIVDAAFGAVADAARAAFGWISGNWSRLQGILTAPFDAAWSVISAIIAKIKAAVSAVSSAIKNIPHPDLPDLNPFGAPSTAGAIASSAVTGPLARGAGASRTAARGAGGPTIVIQGALDPEGVARQVRALLGGHDVRMGRGAIVAGSL